MSTKLSKSVVSKVLAFGLLVGVCVGGVAMPTSATPADPETLATTPDVEALATTSDAKWMYESGSTLHYGLWEMELGAGKKVNGRFASNFELLDDANHRPLGMRVGIMRDQDLLVRAAYPILHFGQPTEFWLQTGITNEPGLFGKKFHGACEVFRGEPGTPGAEAVKDSPFQCKRTQSVTSDGDRHWDFALEPAGGVRAEASGTITPMQGLALTDGTFRSDLLIHTAGASEVLAGQSTNFSVALTGRDDPFYENQARMEFAYQIVDYGLETGKWVAGLSTNFRGKLGFSADGRCAIYNGNPLEGEARLDDSTPIEDPTYSCTTIGETLNGIGGVDKHHFDADFLVGLRPF